MIPHDWESQTRMKVRLVWGALQTLGTIPTRLQIRL